MAEGQGWHGDTPGHEKAALKGQAGNAMNRPMNKIKSGIITLTELENTKDIWETEQTERQNGYKRYWITVTYNPRHHNTDFGNYHVRAKSIEEAKEIAFKEAIKESKEYFEMSEFM